MNKILLLAVFILLIIPQTTFATAQFPDILIYKGKKVSINSNPLESYFNEEHPRPRDLFQFTCTAIWRGYVATWEIKDDYLYLVKLVEGTCSDNAKKIPLSRIFPGAKKSIKAIWYSGTLIIPEGKILDYVHMGYESLYEKETRLTIEDGKLVDSKTIDNKSREIE